MRLSISVLPFQSYDNFARACDANKNVDTVTVSVVGSNQKSIQVAQGLNKGVPHIALNQIHETADVDDVLSKLIHAKISEVLLLGGAPSFGGKYTGNQLEIIEELSRKNITVNVGGYGENYIWKKTDTAHFKRQAESLRAKQDAGASRIITQGIINPRNIARFAQTLRDNGVDIPMDIGIIAGRTIDGARLFLNKMDFMNDPVELDWPLRISASSFLSVRRRAREIIDLDVLTEKDGIHLSTINTETYRYIDAVKSIIG